ncbi:unnamed protein product [Larinioides sclopetarius]|uniref:Uncharacterized protein n=1 Tax=Larinioides sclopetarius TaxID=280406 RepID=A0AAV2BAU7_9ARAC
MSHAVNTQKVGFTVIWKIENFSLATKLPKNDYVQSPVFTTDNLHETSWHLHLLPVARARAREYGNKNTFSFRLFKVKEFQRNCILLDYELSILCNGDSKVKSVTVREFYFHIGNAYGTSLDITPHEIFNKPEILPRDTLTVQCQMWHSRTNCLEPGFSLARTIIGVERKTFTWTIDKFSTLQVNDMKSVSVELEPNLKLSLKITLFLTSTPTYDEKIRMKVEGNNEETLDLIIVFRISAQNVNDKAAYHFEDELKLSEGKKEQPLILMLDKKEFISNKDMLLPEDVLSLKFVLVVFKFSASESIILNKIERTTYGADAAVDLKEALTNLIEPPRFEREIHPSTNSLTNDLIHLFENKYLADISLRVRDEVFPVHKAILSARSPVFKTMFDTNMKEKFTNTIEIDDIEPDTIRRLLLYIYSDTLDSDIGWENASSLCLAAEKYSVIGLKEKCSSFLKQNLSLTNICKTVFLADALLDEDLKNAALTFIEKNDKEVMNSNEWKHFALEHPQLTVEILSRLYRKVKEF